VLTYILFIIGFVLLIKGADFLVNGASAIARRLKISDLIIGLTIVAFGTSAPELIVNIFASTQGNTQIAIGNVIGSNIFNIFLILGISSIIFPLVVTKSTVWKEIPFCLFATLLLGILANDNLIFQNSSISEISRIDAFIFIISLIIFLFYIFRNVKKQKKEDIKDVTLDIKQYSLGKSLLYIVVGLIILNIGAKWVVDGAVELALFFRVSQSLIGLTIVAAGTSLPELATSAVATYNRNTDIAVGNIVGSNIFNILLILGISAMIRPLSFNVASNIDIGVAILAPLILFITMFTGRKKYLLERWEGIIFIFLYIFYLIFLIYRG